MDDQTLFSRGSVKPRIDPPGPEKTRPKGRPGLPLLPDCGVCNSGTEGIRGKHQENQGDMGEDRMFFMFPAVGDSGILAVPAMRKMKSR